MRNINLLLYYKSRFHKIFNFVIKTLNNASIRQVMLVNIRLYLNSRSNQDLDGIPKPMLKNISSSDDTNRYLYIIF
jgi:hypothetical protein